MSYLTVDLTPVITYLAQRGLTGHVLEGDACDFIEAELPDSRLLQITPTAGRDGWDGWVVLLTGTTSFTSEAVYRSHPRGAAQQHGSRLGPMLDALTAVLA
ncbi:hypothetical protein [Kitasatospora sp. NPDC088548]|uniref:hypothetical protein n=1 Tax=Kitasatospora sp. NPDC088548 TaxID=3364075 RepID=UPI00381B7A5B